MSENKYKLPESAATFFSTPSVEERIISLETSVNKLLLCLAGSSKPDAKSTASGGRQHIVQPQLSSVVRLGVRAGSGAHSKGVSRVAPQPQLSREPQWLTAPCSSSPMQVNTS